MISGEAPRDCTRLAPASFGQQSLWFLRQIMPCKTPYNTAVQLRLSGELDAGALVAAVRRGRAPPRELPDDVHPARRRGLPGRLRGGVADVAVVDLAACPSPLDEERRLTLALAAEPFDLERGPLLRVRVFRLGAADHALSVVMDHIVADGLSLDILWRELEALYRAFRAGQPSPLPPPPKQFAACVEAQNAWMATPAFARQLAYWQWRLAGAAPCDLPADRPRPPIKSFRGGFVSRALPRALVDRARALAAAEDVTLFTVLLSALALLVARCSGQRDVLVMIPIACRQRFAADDVIGFFSNMVVLRLDVEEDAAYRDLLRRVGAEIMDGVLRQDVPFEKVVEAVRPERSLAHDPLARIALSFLPAPAAAIDLPGVEATYDEIPNGGSKFDLHVTVTERAGDLLCIAEYNGDIFDAGDDGPAARALRDAPRRGGRRPGVPRRRSAAARARRAAPRPRRVERGPRVAPRRGGRPGARRRLRGARARRRGGLVGRRDDHVRGAPPEEPSGRALPPRPRRRPRGAGRDRGRAIDRDAGRACSGILEAGGAYVPLDPRYPRDRLALMAEDSGLSALVTEERFADVVPAPGEAVLRLDADAAEIAAQSGDPLGAPLRPESLAYVHLHVGLDREAQGRRGPAPRRRRPSLGDGGAARASGPRDRLLAVTSLSFDIAGLELWLPLAVGGAGRDREPRDGASTARALARRARGGARSR